MEAPSLVERHIAGALVKTMFLRDRRGGPWEVPAHLPHRSVSFEGNTGASLAGTWFPAERPRGVVVLAHPDRRYARHWFVKEGYVDLLHEAGYDVLSFDFVGYGGSRGPATYHHEDVIAAAKLARSWSGGFPVHVVGVSMGAFAVANASPRLDLVRSIVLESPYPSFNAWYGKGVGLHAMRAFDRVFPRTSRAIQADRNVADAAPRRILVAYSDSDAVTAPALSERVAQAAPPERTETLKLEGATHLRFLDRADYREALLRTLERVE
jgi:alpha-beta hydrolase superfamily lysophospholipase